MVALAVTVAVITWGAPIALSIYAARKAPNVARATPSHCRISRFPTTPGGELSYFGYEFEVPWNDLDPPRTKLYPPDKPNRVVFTFKSGLRLMVTDLPAAEWVRGLSSDFKVPPETIAATFGQEAIRSDYSFIKMLYEFTPDKMNVWSVSSHIQSRDNMLLLLKSMALSKEADSGIFAFRARTTSGSRKETRGPI